jgi:hypothetical protein
MPTKRFKLKTNSTTLKPKLTMKTPYNFSNSLTGTKVTVLCDDPGDIVFILTSLALHIASGRVQPDETTDQLFDAALAAQGDQEL